MNVKLSKRLKAIVRDLGHIAHEREIRRVLSPIADAFDGWRSESVDTWTLLRDIDNLRVPLRRLSSRYESHSDLQPVMVARAIVLGILDPKEVSAEIVEALAKPISFFREGLANGTKFVDEGDD